MSGNRGARRSREHACPSPRLAPCPSPRSAPPGTRLGPPHQRLELGNCFLDGFEIGRAGRQAGDLAAPSPDERPYPGDALCDPFEHPVRFLNAALADAASGGHRGPWIQAFQSSD